MRHKFPAAIAMVLLISASLSCSIVRSRNTLTWHLLLEIDAATPDRAAAVQKTATVIQQRLDALGVGSPVVEPLDNGRIRVSLPDVPDRERLARVITAGGVLELTSVVTPPSPAPVQTYDTREVAVSSLGGAVPPNRRVLPYSEGNESPDDRTLAATKWVVVEAPAIVDGSELRDATAIADSTGEDYNIAFSLRPSGAEKLGAWTGSHINNYIGVVLNGEVKSIAYIKSQIYDQGEISGRFTKYTAEDLALVLRSGALPAPVRIIEEGRIK